MSDRTARARQLRVDKTKAEAKLWSLLRNRALDGFKFRRQVPIDRYFADFICIDAKLIVEVDGGQHGERVDYDAERTRILEGCGFAVLRFWNHEVVDETEVVLARIRRELRPNAQEPSPSHFVGPSLSPPGRGAPR